jgi:hypothetical protein
MAGRRATSEAELLIWLDIGWNICKARLLARASESKKSHGLRITTVVTARGRLQAAKISSTAFHEESCTLPRKTTSVSSWVIHNSKIAIT